MISRIKIVSLNAKMWISAIFLDILRILFKIPRIVKPGEIIKQWGLVYCAYKSVSDIKSLMDYIHNLALRSNIEQICFICEQKEKWLDLLRYSLHLNVGTCLYTKSLDKVHDLSRERAVYISSIDL